MFASQMYLVVRMILEPWVMLDFTLHMHHCTFCGHGDMCLWTCHTGGDVCPEAEDSEYSVTRPGPEGRTFSHAGEAGGRLVCSRGTA